MSDSPEERRIITESPVPLVEVSTASRKMDCYVATDLELDAIARSANQSTLAFSVALFFLGFGSDWVTSVVNDTSQLPEALPVLVVSAVATVAFGAWGILSLSDRRGVLRQIKDQSTTPAAGGGRVMRSGFLNKLEARGGRYT